MIIDYRNSTHFEYGDIYPASNQDMYIDLRWNYIDVIGLPEGETIESARLTVYFQEAAEFDGGRPVVGWNQGFPSLEQLGKSDFDGANFNNVLSGWTDYAYVPTQTRTYIGEDFRMWGIELVNGATGGDSVTYQDAGDGCQRARVALTDSTNFDGPYPVRFYFDNVPAYWDSANGGVPEDYLTNQAMVWEITTSTGRVLQVEAWQIENGENDIAGDTIDNPNGGNI